MTVYDKAFKIIGEATNFEEAISQITTLFLEDEHIKKNENCKAAIEANVLEYLASNISNTDPDEDNLDKETRIKNFHNFLTLEGSERLINQFSSKGGPLLMSMLSNLMVWKYETLCLVLEKTQNVADIRIGTSGKTSPAESSHSSQDLELEGLTMPDTRKNALEYLISQRSYGINSDRTKDFVIRLMKAGCDFNYRDQALLTEITSDRSIESGLINGILETCIKNGKYEILKYLLENYESGYERKSVNSSGASRSSSMASYEINNNTSLKKIIIEILLKIPSDKLSSVDLDGVSIPRFFLQRKKLPISGDVWRKIQSIDFLTKISSNIFIRDPLFFHEIIKENQRALFEWAQTKLQELGEKAKEVRASRDDKNRTAFMVACDKGFDTFIQELFPEEKSEIEEGLRICARNGFSISLEIIIDKAVARKITVSLEESLLMAIKENGETCVAKLIEKGVNANSVASINIEDSFENEEISALQAAIKFPNNHLVRLLVENGANHKECKEYQEYKSELGSDDLKKLQESEKKAKESEEKFNERAEQASRFITKNSPLSAENITRNIEGFKCFKNNTVVEILAKELNSELQNLSWDNAKDRERQEFLSTTIFGLLELSKASLEKQKEITPEMVANIKERGIEGVHASIEGIMNPLTNSTSSSSFSSMQSSNQIAATK